MQNVFNEELASGLSEFYSAINKDQALLDKFKQDSTAAVKDYLRKKGVSVPDDEKCFHAHAIGIGHDLPDEPERATIERYIYVFRKSGLFEFKVVPGSSAGNDDFMIRGKGACACCNCGCFEVPM